MLQKFIIISIFLLVLKFEVKSCQKSDIFELTANNFDQSLENYQFLYVKFFTEK